MYFIDILTYFLRPRVSHDCKQSRFRSLSLPEITTLLDLIGSSTGQARSDAESECARHWSSSKTIKRVAVAMGYY